MKYCVEHGIPHSTFLSWPPDDQDKVIVYLTKDTIRCSGCGTYRDEWMDPQTGRPLDPPPYTPEELRCVGCLTLAERREVIGSEEGVYVRFLKT